MSFSPLAPLPQESQWRRLSLSLPPLPPQPSPPSQPAPPSQPSLLSQTSLPSQASLPSPAAAEPEGSAPSTRARAMALVWLSLGGVLLTRVLETAAGAPPLVCAAMRAFALAWVALGATFAAHILADSGYYRRWGTLHASMWLVAVHYPLMLLLTYRPIQQGAMDNGSAGKLVLYALTHVALDTPLRFTLTRMSWTALVLAAKDSRLLSLSPPVTVTRFILMLAAGARARARRARRPPRTAAAQIRRREPKRARRAAPV
jgi:hypothetical protein